MSNISIVDYLKMAAGFNKNDSGGMDRRTISPWAQAPTNSTNQYMSPNNFNNLGVPRPPPPPMFRQDRNPMPSRNFQYRDDINRNAFHESSSPHYDNHNYRNNGGRTNDHTRQHYNSPRDRTQNDRYDNRYEHDRNNWRKRNRGYNKQKENAVDQRYSSSTNQDQNDNNSDIECISIVENSPKSNLSDRIIASPDITEIPLRPESANSITTSGSVQELPTDGVSQLERAYNRRISTNSDVSDISVSSRHSNTISTPLHNSISNRPPRALYTPSSPDKALSPEDKREEILLDETLCVDTTGSTNSSSILNHKDQRPAERSSFTSQPTIIPLYPEPNPIVGGEIKRHVCRLCKSGRQSFKSDYDFDMHLTKIHFEDRLMKRIQHPYKCQICFYSPPDCLTKQEKEEDLLIHYGCNEKISNRYYQDECAKLKQPIKTSTPAQVSNTISCEMCNSSHDNERLFIRHITLRHFIKQLSDDLPKKAPFICPLAGCRQEKNNEHLLILHYGVEHNISMDLYHKRNDQQHNSKEVDKLSTREISDNHKKIPSLPPIQLPPQIQARNEIIQAKKNDSLSSNSSLVSIESSLMELDPDTLNKEKLSETQPIKEKKTLVIKRKKVTENKVPNRVENSDNFHVDHQGDKRNAIKRSVHGDKSYHIPKKSRTDRSSVKKSGLQDIDIFAPKDNENESTSPMSSNAENVCRICKSTFVTKKSMYYHLIEKHYITETIKSIKLNMKSKCPKCAIQFEAPNIAQQLTKHYYRLHLNDHSDYKNKDENSIKNPASRQSSKEDNNEDCLSDNSTESELLPPSRIRKTVHTPFRAISQQSTSNTVQHKPSVSSARQRMRDNWQKTSIDSQNHEVEFLNKRIEEQESNHEEQMRLKKKEDALEQEKLEKKKLQDKLEQANVEIAGFKKQLEQQQQSYKNLEEMLIEKHNTNLQLSNDKADAEKSLATTIKELDEESKNKFSAKEEEIQEVQKKLSEQDDKVNDLELSISDKEEEIDKINKSQEDLKNDHEKQLARITKQLDYHKERTAKLNEEKKTKIKENKEMTAELKKKDEKILELEELSNCKTCESKTAQEDTDHINCQKCDDLEKQNKGLLESLERLQKIMKGFEAVIEDKNKNIAELNSKCEDSENNLDQALQTLNELKDSEKQKKDLQKQIKQLQKTLRDMENRQYTNVKLISGLEKKNSELETKVKDFEENNSGSEVKINHINNTLKKLEKENEELKYQCNNSDKEIAEKDSRLLSRKEEVESLKCKIRSYETKILELEKTMRIGTTDSPDIQELALQIKNKDGEVMHLRKTLDNLKIQLRQSNVDRDRNLDKLKESSDHFEMQYSKSQQKIEEFKKILSDAETSILYKENELSLFKKVVNEESVGKLKVLLSASGNNLEIAQASKVISEISKAVSMIKSGMCYNLNEQSYLVKSEPVDDTEESFNSNELNASTSNNSLVSVSNKHELVPVKKLAQVNTEKQIILNVPSVTKKIVSETSVYEDISPNVATEKGHKVVKQEPGASTSVHFNMPSHAARNIVNDARFPNKTNSPRKVFSNQQQVHPNSFAGSRIFNSSNNSQLSPFRNSYTTQQHSPGFVKSTLNLNPHAPISSRNNVQHCTSVQEVFSDNTSKDDYNESDDSDEGLEDFFPQGDPLSAPTSPKKLNVNQSKASASLKDTKKSPSSQLEDFTGKYAEDEEENYTCGICNQFDPPDQSSTTRYTTEWVGCDCGRWFHKPCTKMKKFMKSFSCKSVKMKCLPKLPVSTGHTIAH